MKLTEDEKREISKNNMKLYPLYLMFGYDLLFFYGIKVMFLSEVKGITSARYYAFIFIFCFIYNVNAISN